MRVVLGIDAAWTEGQASGVALLRDPSGTGAWECLRLSPSYAGFLSGTSVDWEGPVAGGRAPVEALLLRAEVLAGAPVDVVAIDMPVASIPIVGRREADREVSRRFGACGCSTHSPSADRPGRIGRELTDGFARSGFPVGALGTRRGLKRLLEVYPHVAILELLSLNYRLAYKVSRSARLWPGHSVAARWLELLAAFARLKAELEARIGPLNFELPTAIVGRLSQLKRYEDGLDAAVSAWVGALYLEGDAVPLGDSTGAIWVPRGLVA